MNAELPPLKKPVAFRDAHGSLFHESAYSAESVEARERILQARIAELQADAKQARMMAWAIIRAAAGESWLTVPHHVVISVNDGCAIERRDDHDGYHFRAIDAAREGK